MVPTLLEHLLVASPADLGPDGGILEPMDDAIRDPQYMASKRVRDGMINYINDCSTVSDWRGMVSDFMITETEKVKNTSREQPSV